ncbi:MAG: exonuclease SbcCD subunit D [Promethearchaeota archaeon]
MLKTNSFYTKFGEFVKNQNPELTIFIHASDLHLGSHQYRNCFRADDFINAFQQILEICISYQADFILLGGDVFTSLEMLPGKLLKIIKILKEFKEFTKGMISIIAIEGNHDIRRFSRGVRFSKRGQSWLKLISNLGLLVLLDGDLESLPTSVYPTYNFNYNKGGKIRIKNVVIYGNHYLGENPADYVQKIAKAIEKEKDLFCVLLQHFGIEGQMENVPGIKLSKLYPLREKVDYLALGHYHLQFILDNWVYNPGSSEAVCSVDSKFRRGIFIVKVRGNSSTFAKEVYPIQLINRKSIWKTLYLPYPFKTQKEMMIFITNRLESELNYLDKSCNDLSNPKVPILYLVLKGRKSLLHGKFNEKELKEELMKALPIVDLGVYQKYYESVKTLNQFLYF